MSDYKVDADWAGKDTLPQDSSLKIVRGSEFQTEFDLIATAIASKWDEDSFVNIDSGAIDNTVIGGNVPASGSFTNLSASGTVVLPSTTTIGNVSSTELGYLDGVTSNIQDQLNDAASGESVTQAEKTKWDRGYDHSVNNFFFTDTTGDLTIRREDGSNLVANMDGRYPEYRTGTFTPQLAAEGGFVASSSVAEGRYTTLYINGAPVISWVSIAIVNANTASLNQGARVIISSLPAEARVPISPGESTYDNTVSLFRGINLKSTGSQVVAVYTGNQEGQLYLLDQDSSGNTPLTVGNFTSGNNSVSMKLQIQ